MELFEGKSGAAGGAGPAGRVVAVVVNANVWRPFDYLWPDALGSPAVGRRVRVPFGASNRRTLGFLVDCDRPATGRQLKAIAEAIDDETQFTPATWRLGRWISRYYLTPLGVALAAMIPSAVGRHATRTEAVVFLASRPSQWPASLGARQRRILDHLLEAKRQGVEPVTLEALLSHSQAGRDSIKRLRARELVRLESRPVRLPELSDAQGADPFELNSDQKKVLAQLEAKLGGGFSCTLLYGVTGSGKTEVYVRAIRRVVEAGRQAIVLAPEIALATQTLQRLLKRLPRVAVLHSGLSELQRSFYYQQIRDGHAAVVVGPRSAVFAPARKLGLIIVDEEHEQTYKQDTAPRYHARDVAVKRAQLEEVPVILGTATPSLESLHNARQGRYHMLRLPKRVSGLPMPSLEIVNLRRQVRPSRAGPGKRGAVELIGRTLTLRMAAALDRRQQVILLMNRRGYASYVFCPKCDWRLACDNCTRLLVYHQATQLAMCHYCQQTAPIPDRCPACDGKMVFFGYGIQRIDSEVARKFPEARVARMDSDTMSSPKQFFKVLDDFGAGRIDILLGTQMVAKGLDFPRVSLVGVVSADTSLAVPDFRAAERTFQLIVQVAGRAGRAEVPGLVVVQTLHEDEPAVKFAASHDYDGFAACELPSRRQTRLPPFTRMIRFIVRHAKAEKAQAAAERLAERLGGILPAGEVTMFGPQPAVVRKIRNQFRFQVLLVFGRAGMVQELLWPQMEALSKVGAGEVVADVDPIQLL